ncbi:MAG: sensor histidine kinase [Panacagrimonas sp.]
MTWNASSPRFVAPAAAYTCRPRRFPRAAYAGTAGNEPCAGLAHRPDANDPVTLDTTAPEDWRILRLLSLYRLLLVFGLLVLHETGQMPQAMTAVEPGWFRWACYGNALGALALHWRVQGHSPGATALAHLSFGLDLLVIGTLVYVSGGVDEGLGTLLLIPAVACALVLTTRMAVLQAAMGTLGMFGEELLRQYDHPALDAHSFTSTGVLGLILFGTSVAANTVAQRARKSEALALRMGSDFDNLSRLNEIILESMQTGVLVLDGQLRIGNLNAAAREILHTTNQADGRLLELESAPLAEHLQDWLMSGEHDESPIPLGPGMAEVVVRISRLGETDQSPIMVLLDDASRVHEQAQQIKLAALGRLSASIAHEIRNPLSAISHAGQLLYEAPEISPDNRRLLSMIHRHSDRIDKIVGDVLALSRREPAEPMSIPLAPWLEDTIALYAEGHRQQRRNVELGHVPARARVRFDPRHLQQLMFNLWDNAFRHGATEGRTVQVSVVAGIERNGRPWLDVADNGPGIPQDLVDNVFEPFFTTAHGGTGLGLYLAREMCEFNQARMSYQQRPVGACFRVSFAPGSAS